MRKSVKQDLLLGLVKAI